MKAVTILLAALFATYMAWRGCRRGALVTVAGCVPPLLALGVLVLAAWRAPERLAVAFVIGGVAAAMVFVLGLLAMRAWRRRLEVRAVPPSHEPGPHQWLRRCDAVAGAALQEKHSIDKDRVYSTGHSNGGGFTYLLWAKRSNVFAAVAPSAARSRSVRSLTPKPAMHIAGEQDTLVRFAVQQRVMNAVRAINGCDAEGRDWAEGRKLYPSNKGAPFVAFIHPGSHKSPHSTRRIARCFGRDSRNSC